jgi:hypothetical protein
MKEKRFITLTPDGQRNRSKNAAAEADEHDVDGLHLDGRKDGHEPHGREAAPENGRNVGAVRLGEVELTLDSEGCYEEAVADLHADVEHEEEADDAHEDHFQNFLEKN